MKFIKWIISFISRTTNIIFVVALLISLSASYISPNTIWVLPFIGLLFPFLIALNILFIIIWLLRKRHFALVSLLAIATCLPQILKLTATNLGKSKTNKHATVIKIISYNVRDFDLYNWSSHPNSKEKIFETIKAKNPDIICFQEFYTDSSKRFNTIRQLQDLGYKNYFFTRELVLRKTDEWGIALFSKLPIKEHGNIMKQDFKTGYGKKPFKGLYADIKIGDTTIRFVNVHLQSIYFGKQDYETIEEFRATQNLDEVGAKGIIVKLKKAFERRAKQADELKKFLTAQTKPIVLCGDFNDLPNSYVANCISKNMKDVFLDYGFGIGHTYNGKIPFLRIDYIMTSPCFDVYKFQVINNKISDHFPVYAELSLHK